MTDKILSTEERLEALNARFAAIVPKISEAISSEMSQVRDTIAALKDEIAQLTTVDTTRSLNLIEQIEARMTTLENIPERIAAIEPDEPAEPSTDTGTPAGSSTNDTSGAGDSATGTEG